MLQVARESYSYMCVLFKTSLANRPVVQHQYLNWTTGMVYQTTTQPTSARDYEDGYEKAINAQKGSEWSMFESIDD